MLIACQGGEPVMHTCAIPVPPLRLCSLKHLVGLVGELPQTHHSSASHPSSVANAAAITASLQVFAAGETLLGDGGAIACVCVGGRV